MIPRTTQSALSGVKVIDVSRVLAGPYSGQLLADHGADVIKVEGPAADETRNWGPPFQSDGISAYFAGLNRNKRNLGLDLAAERGREILRALLRDADVLIENFKLGTLERWGLGEEQLRVEFPRLIHCRITGFGADGPLAATPGYDAVLQAYSGLMSVNGEADGPPLRLGIPIVDLATGLHAFSGILLAIHERDRSGLGQLVDCSLFNTALALLHPQAASWFVDGTVAGRSGSAHPIIAPYDTYPTQTGLVFIGAGSDAQFRTLTRVLDLSELADDPRFGSNPERRRHTAALRDLLAARLADLDAAAVAQALLDEGVPSSPIYNVAQALSSPQTESQGMVVTAGTHYRGVGIPVKLERTPGEIRTAPGQLGADSFNVLAEIGLDATVVRTLMAEGVVVGPDGPAE